MIGGITTVQKLCLYKNFECTKYSVDQETMVYMDDSSFAAIVFLSGQAKMSCQEEVVDAKAGDSFFMSAGRKVFVVKGECEFILTNI